MADEEGASGFAQATRRNGLFRAGFPSHIAVLTAERYHSSNPIFNDDAGSTRWVWGISSGDNKVMDKKQNFPKDVAPSPTSTQTTTSSLSTTFDKEEQEKVKYWLSSISGSTEDPELLSPFTDLTSRTASSLETISLQPISLQRASDASASSGSYQRASLRKLSPPVPITDSEIERIFLNKTIKMYSTPQGGRSAVQLELGVARARALNREPFHSRSGSRSYRDEPSDAPSYYTRSRGNSASSSMYQQLGNQASPERGRSLQNRYEFQSNDGDELLSPVPESAGGNFPSRITTVSDLINMRDEEPLQRSRDMSRHKFPPQPAVSTPAREQEKRRPEPLDLKAAHWYGATVARHANIEAVHNPVPSSEKDQNSNDDSPSVYGASTPFHYYEEPSGDPYKAGLGRGSILKGYSNWMEKQTTEERNYPATPVSDGPVAQAVSRDHSLEKGSRGLPKSLTTNDVTNDATKEYGAPPFTPLTPWLSNDKVKKVKKNLFGDKGWLEDTAAQKKPERPKTVNARFFDGMKKTARKIAGMADFRVGASRVSVARELNITLDPREQSLLYCELEFILSNTLSGYINGQLHLGRMNPHIYAKIADSWAQMGRPKVIGFRYDLETQVDMIYAHIGSFRFHGPHHADSHIVKGLLYGMKMNARVMRIRTHCQPDSVIAKHILDSQALMQLLNSPPELQTSLAEVSQFFRTIIEVRQEKQEKEEVEKSFVDYAPNSGFKPRSQDDLSPPKGKHPGEYRVKNQINVPQKQRDFSGPILEPKVYNPSEQPHALTK
ncbi:hypothetical protein F5Y00DRAFT_268581 [Daldinia vernicosa]|uniref:uncharacterized protein n=1 Tax=Daldinia vernicosa TaxID=114800 RepID=UPI0020087208|nr:uncharacterized protein F5Y00DRAFT_268581 [Daldinia vernicosa]KAI0850053.1 hypothetical protein F5Y00DRAFT_268581 [Daldinia vernicosa]